MHTKAAHFLLLVLIFASCAAAIHYKVQNNPGRPRWIIRTHSNSTTIASNKVNVVHGAAASTGTLLACDIEDSGHLSCDQVLEMLGAERYNVMAISRELPVYTEELWNLDRIDQRAPPLDAVWYNPANTGAGVNVYVVDTGVEISHREFAGRASNFFTAFSMYTDENGHGTHVAGTAAGSTYGVARGALIKNVRVLDASGSGSTYTVSLGLNSILSGGTAPAVINLSLGYFGHDAVIASLIADLQNAGYTVVAAAGNSATDSCGHQPSSLPGVISVAASTQTDHVASFSNYGSCVTMFAPGTDILSAWKQGFTNTLMGTSMATPHVSGAAALILQQHPSYTPAQVKSQLQQDATAGAIIQPLGSPNLLVYTGASQQDTGTASRTASRTPSPSILPSASPPSSSSPLPTFVPQNGGSAASTRAVVFALVAFCQTIVILLR